MNLVSDAANGRGLWSLFGQFSGNHDERLVRAAHGQ
jgi:hypothetical protein